MTIIYNSFHSDKTLLPTAILPQAIKPDLQVFVFANKTFMFHNSAVNNKSCQNFLGLLVTKCKRVPVHICKDTTIMFIVSLWCTLMFAAASYNIIKLFPTFSLKEWFHKIVALNHCAWNRYQRNESTWKPLQNKLCLTHNPEKQKQLTCFTNLRTQPKYRLISRLLSALWCAFLSILS